MPEGADSAIAKLLEPLDGAQNVDTRTPASWTAIDGAQAYYLYVGTTAGAKDLINTGEISATSYDISTLPAGQLVYARLYTKLADEWRYADSTFQTKPVAYLSGTIAASGVLQPDQPITWSPYSGATKYEVYVGTAPGLNNIAQSNETTGTSFTLPVSAASLVNSDQTVYVRLYSYVNGQWLYVDYTPQLEAKALLYAPVASQQVDVMSQRFAWNSVQNAQAYYLYVGTTPGAKDLVDSGETPALQYTAGLIPPAQTVYSRMWTKIGGAWRYADSSFATRPAAAFTYPKNGQVGVNMGAPFSWAAVPGADSYSVEFGSTPGATDLYVSGPLTSTSMNPPALPMTGVIYGRIWTNVPYPNTILLDSMRAENHLAAILDPTFGLVAQRASDGSWASADDIFAATRDSHFTAINYQFLTPLGSSIAKNYYLDYPLLYAHVYSSSGQITDTDNSVLPYFQAVGSSTVASGGFYAIQCPAGQSQITAMMNDAPWPLQQDGSSLVSCVGSDNLSYVFWAYAISPLSDAYAIYTPRRFLF